jgi:hypothetical protein
VDNSKLGHAYIASSLLPEEIDTILVDHGMDEATRSALTAAGITVEVV